MLEAEMRNLETFNANSSFYTKLTNNAFFCIDDELVQSLGIAIGFKLNNEWAWVPKFSRNERNFMNAIFFLKFSFPFGIFMQIRWSDNPSHRRQFWQGGIGWKKNGRFGILCRVQNDNSAAIGYHVGLPNTDQAQGFNYGGK
jgi:hypothetical protein